MMRITRCLSAWFLMIFLTNLAFANGQKVLSHQEKILARANLLTEGDGLLERGFYNEALKKYEVAASPELLNYDYDIAVPYGRIRGVLILEGKFEEALEVFKKVIAINKRGTGWEDSKYKLDALIQAKKSLSTQPVYGYINYLNNKYKNDLPPNFTSFTPIVVSDIIRLYDYIGDYDAGIRFVDQILQYRGLGNRARADYVKVRQAFEQSKAEGIKSCFETQVPGEACVGHATQVVIQSDYIPW